ncbi:similar to Saccharomyces cerevisiae YGR133W PEX4 Peroxisomal ubiquitin conjugating enzyme required for peroxisomal matrix protein import and peroxisome biogenesis [Maudiozyma saulgeensis]|uniref:Similar to Saccharomyces cerevisiae YGR133W PEX4 Peroxisomal ubiquitin conjugating enzyme required for peroxisomal matrix protein import and peroxisome biogenesis n=1 Tax=Maudiozyma saulgeensis TaxID=1789683 RepID=A0A1X7QY26_9SACH|nr:similar to Saccharomyces cerevisiae YGR133W PEX4 Peroxisomal ubiquitin conjugating enzyme required for peroxisomal matrix protein import and peroxisome biogenesis [Kazachstania saulgeensis]
MSRLAKEYKAIMSQDDILLLPQTPDDLTSWIAILVGPKDTPFEGHDFKLFITVPESYPSSPPQLKFEPNHVPHVNVDYKTGEICLDILKGEWSPVYNLLYTVQSIQRLLKEPNADSPLNLELGILMREGDEAAYNGLVKYYLSRNR